jgi:hypothetical protein
MEKQQIMVMLKTMQEKKYTNREANQEEMRASHKEMMAILDAHHERMMACLGKTEATDQKTNPEENESVAELQEVPKEHAEVKPVKRLRKRHRGWNLAAEHH